MPDLTGNHTPLLTAHNPNLGYIAIRLVAGGVRLSFDTLRLREDLEGLQRKRVICIGVIISAFASVTNYTPGAAVCQIVQHGLVQALLCM